MALTLTSATMKAAPQARLALSRQHRAPLLVAASRRAFRAVVRAEQQEGESAADVPARQPAPQEERSLGRARSPSGLDTFTPTWDRMNQVCAAELPLSSPASLSSSGCDRMREGWQAPLVLHCLTPLPTTACCCR